MVNFPAVVNQKGASAGLDLVGRDKITNYTVLPAKAVTKIELLLEKLTKEIDSNERVRDTLDSLSRFHKKRTIDGIDGLEAKLKAGGREYETFDALEKKELFSKLLERYSHYASAQEILACLLARVEYNFQSFVYPQVDGLSIVEINELVDARIIEPTIIDCGVGVLSMDHSVAMGMVYWLAEQCYVRWHK
ncbi:hypothetical protein BK672_10980 [Pseudomonas fluorescens]|uniref:ABC-three component systems C-terminal domain-containing protein n=1 Tax=Pseudomonas fluorescens TaxID=294 RepID=A0A423NB29_PSEFL|nr:ABC-three component system protein [Pseudomonas fluorescens]RON95440.1 hypothetical protein BK672_10980 [Pseudomonas fluorescens]